MNRFNDDQQVMNILLERALKELSLKNVNKLNEGNLVLAVIFINREQSGL